MLIPSRTYSCAPSVQSPSRNVFSAIALVTITGTRQTVGTGQASRAGTDHRDLVAAGQHIAQLRLPAGGQGGINDVFLHRTDGHRTEFFQRAAALAQAVLRADPAADFR